MKLCRQKVVWMGVYHTITVFGNPGRLLEAVLPSRLEAEAWLHNALRTHKHWDKKEFHFEEVDATMRAWEC